MARPKHRPTVDFEKIDEITWARLAAYIDGEGHISITYGTTQKRHKSTQALRRYLRVMVTNTDPRLIRWLLKNFGGSIGHYSHPKTSHWRHTLKWGVACRQAESILIGCWPYFITKKDQAEIAIAFQSTYAGYNRWKTLPKKVQRQREQLHKKLIDARWEQHEYRDLQTADLRKVKSGESVN
jgi:hypothetical protein